MSIIVVMVIGAVIGLGVFLAWVLSGVNFKYAGLFGSIMQGLIILPFLAIGGVCAFFLFGHLMGVQSVALLDLGGLRDILAMVALAAALGGIPLGIIGYFGSKMPS